MFILRENQSREQCLDGKLTGEKLMLTPYTFIGRSFDVVHGGWLDIGNSKWEREIGRRKVEDDNVFTVTTNRLYLELVQPVRRRRRGKVWRNVDDQLCSLAYTHLQTKQQNKVSQLSQICTEYICHTK